MTMASNSPLSYRRVLTIAGSDSGGGAGIQADLKTFAALGCFGMSAITALTAQNTRGVTSIHPVPPAFVAEQIAAVLGDIGADAVKIGMLYSAELIEAVALQLERFEARNIVLDPVMVAQSGDKLLQDTAVDALKHRLMPMADVLTPNLPEAEILSGRKLADEIALQSAARNLAASGCRSILIKGGHGLQPESNDLLYLAASRRFVVLSAQRLPTQNNHGTGCTLSSAIAAHLARGSDLETAARKAKEYMQSAIRAGAGYRLGHGHGPVHHFYAFWE
jgi:hydroxymethylpyrimidine/phosphomethylpyrimidine kinase